MKKWALGIFAALAVGYFGLLPFESTDAGELYVVETLLVEADENQVRLYSGDTMGSGATPAEAVQDMERKAPGQLFLRQTKRLIFCDGAEQNCNPMELPEQLPMGAGVYAAEQTAEALLEEQEDLENILEARERRQQQSMPTLADMKNCALRDRTLKLAPLEQGEHGERS